MLFCDGSEGQPGTRHGGRGKKEFCQCADGDRDGMESLLATQGFRIIWRGKAVSGPKDNPMTDVQTYLDSVGQVLTNDRDLT